MTTPPDVPPAEVEDPPAAAFSRAPLTFVTLIAVTPLLVGAIFVAKPEWSGIWIGLGVVWVVSAVLAFLDSRAVRASGVALNDQVWANSLVVPAAYLVPRTLAARSSWLVPAGWVATSGIATATVLLVGLTTFYPAAQLNQVVGKWLVQNGIQGQLAVDCPDLVGREGDVITCDVTDGGAEARVEVKIGVGGNVEFTLLHD